MNNENDDTTITDLSNASVNESTSAVDNVEKLLPLNDDNRADN